MIQGLLGVCCTFLLLVGPKKCCFKYSLFFFTKSANTNYPVICLVLAQDKLSQSIQQNSITLLPDYVLFWFLIFCLFAENCFLSLVYIIHPLHKTLKDLSLSLLFFHIHSYIFSYSFPSSFELIVSILYLNILVIPLLLASSVPSNTIIV